MNKLNERILKNFKDNIAISNLREECIMKKFARKQMLIITMGIMIMLSGGFITVYAATNGQVVDEIKDTIKVVFVTKEGKLKATDEDVDNLVTYEVVTDGNEFYNVKVDGVITDVDVKEIELDEENMKTYDYFVYNDYTNQD